MISYQTEEKKYYYNVSDIDNIIKLIEDKKLNMPSNINKENVEELIFYIKNFLDNITEKRESVIATRHETEEEAREYFGEDFINQLNNIFLELFNQDTCIALHGTYVDNCDDICEDGLYNLSPSLSSTTIIETILPKDGKVEYNDFEKLLNWPHKARKGIVIVAVPYECLYKYGIWNHFQDLKASLNGVPDYKIDPEFIYGYIDVKKKKIVLNSKYSRLHNYQGYETDLEAYKENKTSNNEQFKNKLIESYRILEEELLNSDTNYVYKDKEYDISRLPSDIEDLIGFFNSIKSVSSVSIDEERYKIILNEILRKLAIFKASLPKLKTQEEIRAEAEAKYSVFNESVISSDIWDSEFDWPDIEDSKPKL